MRFLRRDERLFIEISVTSPEVFRYAGLPERCVVASDIERRVRVLAIGHEGRDERRVRDVERIAGAAVDADFVAPKRPTRANTSCMAKSGASSNASGTAPSWSIADRHRAGLTPQTAEKSSG